MICGRNNANGHVKLVISGMLFLLAMTLCIQSAAGSQLTSGEKQGPSIGYASPAAVASVQQVSRIKLVFTINGRDIDCYYTGPWVENHPAGEGLYEFDDTHGLWSFAGTLENGIFASGTMTNYPYTMTFDDDRSYSTYTGPFEHSQPAGEGLYTIVADGHTATLEGHYDPQFGFTGSVTQLSMSFVYNGVSFSGVYTGEYLNGQPNGEGHFASEGELFFFYDGIWDNGSIVGPGELHTNNAQLSFNGTMTKAEYQGNIENGCFNGEGTISIGRDAEGSYVYSGNWLNNVYSGYGTLTVSREGGIGYTYTGSWKEGVYDGEGALIYDQEDIVKYIGHFEQGRYRPTFVEMIACLCSAGNNEVELSEPVLEFIREFQEDFIRHAVNRLKVDKNFSYDAYAESQDEETDVCFAAFMEIVQIREYDAEVFGYPVTEFLGQDKDGKMYYGHYIGILDEIKTGDMTEIVAYPISYFPYKSQNGESIPSVRFLACSVEKSAVFSPSAK